MQKQLSALLEVVEQVAQNAMVDLSVCGTERLFRVRDLQPGERACLGWLINQVKAADRIILVPEVYSLPKLASFLPPLPPSSATPPAILHFYAGFPVKYEATMLGVLSVMTRADLALTVGQQRAIATLADQLGYLLGACQQSTVSTSPVSTASTTATPPDSPQLKPVWPDSSHAMLQLSMALQKCLSLEDLSHHLCLTLPQAFPIAAFELVLAKGGHTAQTLCQWSAAEINLPTLGAVHCHQAGTSQSCLLSTLSDCEPSTSPLVTAPGAQVHDQQTADADAAWDCYQLKINHRTVGALKICWRPIVTAEHSIEETTIQTLVEQISITIHRLQLLQKLQSESLQDPLTKLFNRRYMMSMLDKLLQRVSYGHYQVGLIMMDIDHFKQLNDTFGHDAGDQVLRVIGLFFKGHARPNDVMCRYGGEEFALILPEITWEVLERRANQLCRAVKYLSLNFHQESLHITLSAGYAIAPTHGTTSATLMKAADQALYVAKRAGRDRAVGASMVENLAQQD